MPSSPREKNQSQDIPAMGIWNTRGKGRYPVGACDTAQNVDIIPDSDDKTGYEIRPGSAQVQSFTNATDSFSTQDGSHLFVIDDGDLLEVFADFSSVVLATGMGSGSYDFLEIGSLIAVMGENSKLLNGPLVTDFFIPQPESPTLRTGTGYLPSGQYTVAVALMDVMGRLGPLSIVQTINLSEQGALFIEAPVVPGFNMVAYATTHNGEVMYELGPIENTLTLSSEDGLVTPVSEEQIGSTLPGDFDRSEYFEGKVYVSQYVPSTDITYILFSKPYWLNLFRPQSDFIAIRGRLNSMDAVQGVLIISTNQQIVVYKDGALETLADYGTVPGSPTAIDRATDKLYLWTTRGVCEALPLKNLTEEKVSLPPGSEASTAFLNVKGTKRFMVLTDTLGDSFNKY